MIEMQERLCVLSLVNSTRQSVGALMVVFTSAARIQIGGDADDACFLHSPLRMLLLRGV